ncbi:MAG: hypothetical protein A2Z81_04500 [Omnitrophica WOR_2 bacterium GWA2_45_18]|nr:MAG: hypothetical protein A2Z81_04500 [Omnitrophica WOR_2 bacterium GWA2_45_18]
MPKKQVYNHRLIKSRRTYTLQELAEVFGLHVATPQLWLKQGLKPIESTRKPYLIRGEEIIRFLKETRQKRKHSLKPGEFFCIICREPRCGKSETLAIKRTNKTLGNTQQVILLANCEVCNRRMILFSSDRKIKEWQESKLIPSELEAVLFGYDNHSLNTGLTRGVENEN